MEAVDVRFERLQVANYRKGLTMTSIGRLLTEEQGRLAVRRVLSVDDVGKVSYRTWELA